jgi:hypothetical protein
MNVNAALRVAVVGPGGWGRQHTRIFGSHPDTELVAIVGRGSERVQAQAQAARTAGFTDIGAMLDAVQPDLVSVCLLSEHHFEPTLRLVRALTRAGPRNNPDGYVDGEGLLTVSFVVAAHLLPICCPLE